MGRISNSNIVNSVPISRKSFNRFKIKISTLILWQFGSTYLTQNNFMIDFYVAMCNLLSLQTYPVSNILIFSDNSHPG